LDFAAPPVAYVLPQLEPDELADIESYVAWYPEAENNRSQPFIMEGRGLIADKRLLTEIAGAEGVNALIEDLHYANWDEWHAFVTAMNAWIRQIPMVVSPAAIETGTSASAAAPAASSEPQTTPTAIPSAFTLGEHVYELPDQKGVFAAELNGVFAVAGGEPAYYGHELLTRALCTSDLSGLYDVSALTTPAALEILSPGLSVYADTLDLLTSSIAGKYAAGIRGKDFVKKSIYGTANALEIFSLGRAVFADVASSDYEALKNENALQAKNLVLLPLKLPYDRYGLPQSPTGSAVQANDAIPLAVTHSFYLNKEAPASQRARAAAFIRWLSSNGGRFDDPLERAVKDYYAAGEILAVELPAETAIPESFEQEAYSSSGITVYLANNNWDEALHSALIDALFTAWYVQ
jgi:raffinose/stachyose/melibiose transport system substrate-binding protein